MKTSFSRSQSLLSGVSDRSGRARGSSARAPPSSLWPLGEVLGKKELDAHTKKLEALKREAAPVQDQDPHSSKSSMCRGLFS